MNCGAGAGFILDMRKERNMHNHILKNGKVRPRSHPQSHPGWLRSRSHLRSHPPQKNSKQLVPCQTQTRDPSKPPILPPHAHTRAPVSATLSSYWLPSQGSQKNIYLKIHQIIKESGWNYLSCKLQHITCLVRKTAL